MYNHQLDTFMRAAELGSFTKAAEKQYISPSAVQQQINNLEESLGVKLFQRSRRTISLTAAGELLYEEAPKLIEISGKIKQKLSVLTQEENSEISVGASANGTIQLFFKWWIPFEEGQDGCSVRFKTVSGLGHRDEWEDVDIMEGVYVGDFSRNSFEFLPLTEVQVIHAVWKEHPLAQKEKLSLSDMKGQTLVTIAGESHLIEDIRNKRRMAEEQGMKVITVEYYDASIYNMCALNGYIIETPRTTVYAQSGLVEIPCDGDFSIPYGFYYRKDAPDIVKRFIAYVKENNTDEKDSRA